MIRAARENNDDMNFIEYKSNFISDTLAYLNGDIPPQKHLKIFPDSLLEPNSEGQAPQISFDFPNDAHSLNAESVHNEDDDEPVADQNKMSTLSQKDRIY